MTYKRVDRSPAARRRHHILDAVAVMKRHGDTLHRRTGGFWTYEGCPENRSILGNPFPDWHIGDHVAGTVVEDGYAEVVEREGGDDGQRPKVIRLIQREG